MPSVVFDASTLVGALLKSGLIPERALLLARARERICLSNAVESEFRDVFAKPKLARYLRPGRVNRFLALVTSSAHRVEGQSPDWQARYPASASRARFARKSSTVAPGLPATSALLIACARATPPSSARSLSAPPHLTVASAR